MFKLRRFRTLAFPISLALLNFGSISSASNHLNPDTSYQTEAYIAQNTSTILQVQDALERGDRTRSGGNFYDVHTFNGSQGQRITIRLESNEFDTFLLLTDSNGETIASNNDFDGTNSYLGIELPKTDIYLVSVSSLTRNSRGRYRLTIANWASPAMANIVVSGGCHSGAIVPFCIHNRFISKTLIAEEDGAKLYKTEFISGHNQLENPNSPIVWERTTSTAYVLCSTEKPTYAWYDSNSREYIATGLNPGSEDSQYNIHRGLYPMYWLTCHNFVGPVFFSQEMTRRARALGYPLNLPLYQVPFTDPLGILYGMD